MNKRGIIIKTGIIGTSLLVILLLIILILSTNTSSAILQKNTYNLNEKIKINLEDKENYKLTIQTPSETLIKKGSNEIFIYKPTEPGIYIITLDHNNQKETYEFEVISPNTEKLEQTTKDFPVPKIIQKNNISENTSKNKEKEIPIKNNNENKIIIDKPVKWTKTEIISENKKIKIPVQAKNITLKKDDRKIDYKTKKNTISNIFSRITSLNKNLGDKNIIIDDKETGEIKIEYYTDPATTTEKIISSQEKKVIVSSPRGLHYENILSYTTIPEITSNKNSIKLYWKDESKFMDFNAYDTDNNNLLDYIEWTVPHLSEQTFEIIIITDADHLNEERELLESVYEEVKERDDIWKEIPTNHYIRAKFETNLTSGRDISIYARSNHSNARVKVYEKDKSDLLADFGLISENKKYRIFLTDLANPQDTFDLKVTGNPVEFDYIVDPACTTEYNFTTNSKPINHAGSWAVKITGWHTADDSAASAGKNPEDTATTNLFDFDFETDGTAGKLKLKDKANNDGQWLKIDTGISPGQTMVGDVLMRVMGADVKLDTTCGGKQTWTDFTNVIAYLYTNSTAINTTANFTDTIANTLISNGCTTATSACTVDAVELNLTDLYNQAPAGQNFTIRLIADSGFGNNEIKEIVETYMQYEIYVESNSPNISLISPSNNSVDVDGSILFEYNVTDESNITSCSLITDGSIDQTDTSITKNITQNFTGSLSNGLHNWSVNCTDSSGNANVGTSEIWIINVSLPIDNQAPTVNLISPSNGATKNGGTIDFVYNVSDNLAIANCSLIIDGTINTTDTSVLENMNQTISVFLPDSTYQWSVNCTDNSENANIGNSTTFSVTTLDTTSPNISLLTPVDFYNSTSDILTFTYNATDPYGINNCSLVINNIINKTDTTITSGAESSFSQSFVDASYNWSVSCYDASPTKNYGISTNRTFNITTPYCLASDFNFTTNSHPISNASSWAVKTTGWHTAPDTAAANGKDPEDYATTTMFDFDVETDGSINKLKLKDKANNDGQWLKIVSNLPAGYNVNGDIILRIVGADLNGVSCKGKQTWADFTNVIVYVYNSATTVDSTSGITTAIGSALINPGCTTPSSSCTVDAVEVNVTSLYANAAAGQNFTLRAIADSGFGNNEISEIVEVYLQYESPDLNIPTWSNQGQTSNIIGTGSTNNLWVTWNDIENLESIWLATNESGTWQNYTARKAGLTVDDFTSISNIHSEIIAGGGTASLSNTLQGYVRDAINISYNYASLFDDTFDVIINTSSTDISTYQNISYYIKADQSNYHRTSLIVSSSGTDCDATIPQTVTSTNWEKITFNTANITGSCTQTAITQFKIRISDENAVSNGAGNIILDELFLTNDTLTSTVINYTWKNDSITSGDISWRIYANDTGGNLNQTDILTFEIGDVTLPQFDLWNLSVSNGASLTRNDIVYAFSNWTDDTGLSSGLTQHSGTGTYANYSVSFVGALLNYTLNLSDLSEFSLAGRINVTMLANDTNNNFNETSPVKYFYLYGYANISQASVSPATILNGSSTTLSCTIIDRDSGSAIPNYNVSFFNSSDYFLGSNLSDASGIASISYTDNSLNETSYNLTCNITDQTSIYYYAGALNNQSTELTIVTDFLYSKITNGTLFPTAISPNYNTTISCTVADNVTLSPISNYNVTFESNVSGSIGSNITGSDGIAYITYTPTTGGTDLISCNITDDGSYTASSENSLTQTLTVSTICTAHYNFSSNAHGINNASSWAVKITGWHTASDTAAANGKDPEDEGTTSLFDFNFETDGNIGKLKLKDKANNDGQWLKIDTGINPDTQTITGDIIMRVMGADVKLDTTCGGKQTWTDFTNAIVYLYANSTGINSSANVSVPISTSLINKGCTTSANSCTVDAVEINITSLYSQAPSGQNFTIRLIADSGFGNNEIKMIPEIYLQYAAAPDTEFPSVNLTSPANNTIDTDGVVQLNYTVSDNVRINSCDLIIDGSIDQTDTSVIMNTNQSFDKILSDGLHNWSVNCTDGNSNTASSETWIINISLPNDNDAPNVTLISPQNGTTDTDGTILFEYNVTDNLAIVSCSLIIDGSIDQTDTSITEDITQNFTQSLRNGWHNWSVNCTDNSANANVGNSSTWMINASASILTGRWYETSTASYTTPASINLSQTQDGTENDATFDITSGSLATLSTATSITMGNNGALIGANSNVDFSGYFTASKNNKGYITWKLYSTNLSGDTLICKHGNDDSSGTRITSATGTFTGSCTAPSTTTIINAGNRLKLVVNIRNTDGGTQTYGHHWDNTRLSFVDINNFKQLGFLESELVSPLTDPNIGVNDLFNMTCQVKCADGNCTNTNVYAQYKPSGGSWTDISSTGNLILNTGTSNPQSAGELDSTYVNYTFEIKGNSISTNTIRCRADSDYSNTNGTTTTTVTVGGGSNTPTVILTNPSSGTAQNTSNITLYYNASDVDLNIVNSSLILNNQINQTNQSTITNGAISNFTLTNLADGLYTWSVNVTDATNLIGNSSTWNFTIDTQAPNITLHNPLANESFNTSTLSFNFTVTDNLDSTLTCDLIIDSTIYENDFSATNGTVTNFTETIGPGTHFWNVTCLDDAGSTGISQTRNFTVTDEPPVIMLITSNNTFSTTGNITLIYNTTDNDGFTSATLVLNNQLNQTNSSEILNGQYNNFTLTNLVEGVYTWDVNVTDTGTTTANNGTPRTFTVDLNNPNVTLNSPANNTISNTSSLSFNFTVTDTIDTSLICNLTIGDYQDLNFAATNGSLTNRDITSLTDGGKYWNVTCFDDSGRSGISENYFINITEYPTITLNTANDSFFNTTTFNLSYTPSDNTNLSSCDLYIDGIYNQTNSSAILNGQENNFTVSGISQGQHNWSVLCTDYANLQNQSETRLFTVDTNGLSIQLIYPPNGTQLFTDTVEFSYNATDNIDNFLDCNITVNSIVLDSFSAQSGNITNRSVFFSQGGFKLWNVTCIDDSNNRLTSETRNFTLAFAPIISLTSPSDGYFWNSSSITLYYNITDDNNNIANSSLILNNQINQTNSSVIQNSQINNFTVTGLTDGFYTWSVNATDLTNLKSNSSTWNFTIDTQVPQLTINGPLQDEIVTDNNVTLNFTVLDNLDTNLTCNITIDGFTEIQDLNASNGTDTINYVLRNDGNYTWDVKCWDDANNFNQSDQINFSVIAPPNVSLISPENNYRTNSSDITFSYIPQDSIGIIQCELWIDGSLNNTDTSITKNQLNSFPVTGISEGQHNWTVNCTDADDNPHMAPERYFQIDLTPPTIQLNSPKNSSTIDFNQGYVTFNWTATDALDTNLTCNLTLDGAINQSYLNITSGNSYTTQVNSLALGQHLWNVTCWDTIINNTNISETWEFTISLIDLSINTTDIVFNNTSPEENETISINATIWNLVNVTTSNITVQFFEGNSSSGGTQIGSNHTISTLQGLSSTTLSQEWNAVLGTTQIFVLVDPPIASGGLISESNENNNEANKSITIGAWEIIYGDIDSNSVFQLADSNSSKILIWNATNFESGNIYATDSDSIISWTDLQAIGKNITGDNATTNDFTDIDVLLNMTDFFDSITLTFTESGIPRNKSNFITFNKQINEVPITNSTNNTNFQTGILWDMSDDSDSEFSQSDTEDLVFITKINKDKIGAYGTYDYEIRVPVKLREYKPSGTTSVAFYTEIK